VALELIVTWSQPGDRSEPWIDALLWAVADDAQLIEAQRFKGGAEMRVWLKAITTEHGYQAVRVRWTDALKGNKALCQLIAACLAIPLPAFARQSM
jgi:hypothetical protein